MKWRFHQTKVEDEVNLLLLLLIALALGYFRYLEGPEDGAAIYMHSYVT